MGGSRHSKKTAVAHSRISIIAALAENRAIGKDNALLFGLPEDLKRFKTLTTGHPVIMGRKTWESLPERFRPLPSRTNIVLTRDPNFEAPGATVAPSLSEAISIAERAPGKDELFIIGGAQIYAEAISIAERLYLTLVAETPEGDAFFPAYEDFFSHLVSEEQGEDHGLAYRFVTLER